MTTHCTGILTLLYSDRIKSQSLSSKDPLLIFIAAYIHASNSSEADGYQLIRLLHKENPTLDVEKTRFLELFNRLREQELVSTEEVIAYCEDQENVQFDIQFGQITQLANGFDAFNLSFS